MNVNNLILALSVETQPIPSTHSDAGNSFADVLGGIQSTLGEITGQSADAASHGPVTDKSEEDVPSDVTQQPGPFGEGEVTALIGLPIVTQEPVIPVDTADDAGALGAESASDSVSVTDVRASDFSASAPYEQTVVFTQDQTVAGSHETPQAAPTAPASEVTRAESTAVTPERSQAVFSFVVPNDTQETSQTADTQQPLPFGMTEPLPKTNEDGMTVQATPIEELSDDMLATMLAEMPAGELQGDIADRIRAILARRAQEAQAEQQAPAETASMETMQAADITPPERTQQSPETTADHRDDAAPGSKAATQPDPAAAQAADAASVQPDFEPIMEATTHISQVPKQLSDFIVGAQGSDNFTIRMKLQPEGMGELHVKVRFEKGEVSLQVLASSEAAGDMLRQGGQELSQNLEQRGYMLQSLDIGLNGDGGQQDREQSFSYLTSYAHDAADDIVIIPDAYAAAVRSQGMYYTA